MALLGVWLLRRFASEESQEKWEKPIGALLLFLVLLTVFHLINPGAGLEDFEEPGGGGLVGWIAGELLISAVGVAGSVVIIMALTTLGLILISGLSLAELMDMVRNAQDEVSDWRRRRALATLNHQPVSPLPGDQSRPALGFLPGARLCAGQHALCIAVRRSGGSSQRIRPGDGGPRHSRHHHGVAAADPIESRPPVSAGRTAHGLWERARNRGAQDPVAD